MLKQLYNGLLEDGDISISFEEFQNKFQNNSNYRQLVHSGIVEDGNFSGDYNTFENKFLGKAQGSTVDPTMSQENMGSQLGDGSSESVSWFDQTWFGRGVAAASTTGEATDLMAQDFSNIDMKSIQEFMKAKESEAKSHVPSERMNKFQKQYIKEGKTWSAFFRGVKDQPGLLPELFVQSLGTQFGTAIDSPGASAAAVAAGAATGAGVGVAGFGVGAIAGGLAGAMGGLATSMEAALTFGELIETRLKEKGLEFTDENIKNLLETEGTDIRNRSIGRGLTIGAIEGFSGGLAGKAAVATKKAVGVAKGVKAGSLAASGAGVGVEAVGGATGEVLGRVAAGQEMDAAEIGFEAITGTTTAPINILAALKSAKQPTYKLNGASVTYEQMKDFVDTADPMDIARANIQMEDDYTGIGKKAKAKQEAVREGIKLSGDEATIAEVDKAKRDNQISNTIEFAETQGKRIGKDVKVVDNDVAAQEFYDKLVKQGLAEEKNVKGADGFIIGDSIIINKDIAGKTGQINVGAHEVLHGILAKHLKNLDQPKLKSFISDFKNTISKESRDYIENIINKRNEAGENLDLETTDEWLTIYSDGITKEQISFNESIFTKFKNFVQNIFRKFGYNKEFKSGLDTYNFMRDYQKSIKEGALSQRAIDVAGGGTTVTDIKKSLTPERKSQIEQEVKDIGLTYDIEGGKQTWDAGGSDIAITEIKEGKYFDDLIAATYKADIVPKNFVEKVYSELTSHIKKFNPEQNNNLFAYINSQVRNKAGNVYNREYKVREEMKGAKDIDARTKEGAPVVQVAAEPTQDFDVETQTKPIPKSQRARVLKDLSEVDLQNNPEIDATVLAEVEALINQNPKNLEQQLEKLIGKEFAKIILNDMGKISKVKGEVVVSDEYKAWHALSYDNIVNSLSDDVIKNNYKTLFDIKKVSREKDKKVNPITGKVTYPGKGIFEISTNKAKWTKYFTEGGYTTLLARQKSLAKLIAQAKTKKAVDIQIETNSTDLNKIVDAKLRKLSASLDNQNNQIGSFDSVKFSITKEFVQNVMSETEQLYATGNFVDKPRALEQAFINLLTRFVSQNNYDRVQVLTEFQTEVDGMADMMFGIKDATGKVFARIGIEIKQGTTDVRLTSNRISSYDVETGNTKFTKKDPYISAQDGSKIINREKIVKSVRKEIKEYYADVNSTIEAWNNGETIEEAPYKRKKGQPELPSVKNSNDIFPGWVHGVALNKKLATNVRVKSKITEIALGPLAENAYASKKHPSQYIEFLGNLFSLGPDVTFNGDVTQLEGLAEAQLEMSRSASLKPAKTNKGKYTKQMAKDFPGMKFGTTAPRIMPSPTKFTSKAKGSISDPNYLPGLLQKHYPSFSISKPIGEIITLNNAIKMSRSINNPTKGITVLDFDDTLATTKSLVKFTTPEGETGTLNAEQYASSYEGLLDKGYTFDFSDFNKVVKGKLAPLFNKAIKLQGKFGPENMFVLTARPPAAQKAIFDFLKANGLNIPLKNITGLGNSTAEAKALWIADKVGEGFNDFYFADDALQNVQAVKNMLDQFDVKSKVQQAKVKFSKSMNDDFNNILEDVTGIDAGKRFSDTKARKRGESKGKFRFFIPPSHEDFVGLLYNFMGKGKKGNEHRSFFEQALVRPLNRAYREIDTAKQAIANDYKSLNKQFSNVKEKLIKNTPDGDFTFQDAIRVYLWNKHGYNIPGLSKTDQAGLVEIVMNDSELQAYAETLNVISKQEKYVDPGPNWETGNIRIDLVDATGRVGRESYFTEFNENVEVIFSPENLNKIEAAYGKDFRSALEDMLHRIKTGVNRPKGSSAKPNVFMNWLNASVSGVMFFNTRSALLQQMSNVNFLNFADNNILAAGKAFANQPQYWKDFAMIFNSDMLKQRRGGLQTDINGAELAEAIKKARPDNMFDQVSIIVGKALRLGFLPTQIGDNIAIATGGAAFYRNRVNKLMKDGMSKKEAEAAAFTDLQNITQSTQQSARPDMTSKQQASWIGKLVLNFLNTPSQYNRIIKKAGSDIINRRITPPNTNQTQSDMSNMSRILYYGVAQNLIFYGLQTALFAVMFGMKDDDEEKRAEQFLKKKERVINGSIDTILRGSGIYGVAVSTLKNMIIKFAEQREKGYNKDESAVIMELANFSPVVGIKLRKIVNAEKTLNYNKKIIDEMETFDIDNPQWSAVTNYVEAITTAPTNRIYQKTINLRNASDNQYTALQRALFFSGYTTWSLNLGDTKKMKDIKESVKSKKKSKKKTNKIKLPKATRFK